MVGAGGWGTWQPPRSWARMRFNRLPVFFVIWLSSLSHVWLCNPMDCNIPVFPVTPGVCSNSCPLSGWCHPTISTSIASSPPALNLSQLQGLFPMSWLFASGSQINWSFSFSISPSDEYSGLISFKIDWFDLLAVQGTLKSFLLHHSLKASVLQHSAFFRVQLSSYWYVTTGKTIVLTMNLCWKTVISAF